MARTVRQVWRSQRLGISRVGEDTRVKRGECALLRPGLRKWHAETG